MSAEYLGFTENLMEITAQMVTVDLLRIHGIKATDADVQTGGFRSLVRARAMESSRGRRVTA